MGRVAEEININEVLLELMKVVMNLSRRVAKLEGKRPPGMYIKLEDGREIDVDEVPGGIASIRHLIVREAEELRKERVYCTTCERDVEVNIPKGVSIQEYLRQAKSCPRCGKSTLIERHKY